MNREQFLKWLTEIIAQFVYSDSLLSELSEILKETGVEHKFVKTLLLRLHVLGQEGAYAVSSKEFEPIGEGLFSMHLPGKGYNIRILYGFLENQQPALLYAFYERAGKRKTDYTTHIPVAKERLKQLREG